VQLALLEPQVHLVSLDQLVQLDPVQPAQLDLQEPQELPEQPVLV
jgi:hypothetical protein